MITVNFINKYLKVNQIQDVLKHNGARNIYWKKGEGKLLVFFFFVETKNQVNENITTFYELAFKYRNLMYDFHKNFQEEMSTSRLTRKTQLQNSNDDATMKIEEGVWRDLSQT